MGGLVLNIKKKGVFWIENDKEKIKVKIEKCNDKSALVRINAPKSVSIWREDAKKQIIDKIGVKNDVKRENKDTES